MKTPSLLLLDIMLPEEDGLTVLKKLRMRSETRKMPIIMLTAKGTEYDKVKGLDAGADDYISKPFGMMELISRVKALLRRTGEEPTEKCLTLGELAVYPERHRVKVSGQTVELTLKEFDTIWGYAFDGESRTVDVHIRTLRQKLGDAGHLIRTVRGVGYCVTLPE